MLRSYWQVWMTSYIFFVYSLYVNQSRDLGFHSSFSARTSKMDSEPRIIQRFVYRGLQGRRDWWAMSKLNITWLALGIFTQVFFGTRRKITRRLHIQCKSVLKSIRKLTISYCRSITWQIFFNENCSFESKSKRESHNWNTSFCRHLSDLYETES